MSILIMWLIWNIFRVPTVLEKSLNFGFSLQSHWKWICPWKVLEFRGPSLKFQLVVLDFLFCVFWTESLNGYSKFRGTRAKFSPKIRLALLAAAYKFNIFPYNSRTIVIISFLSQEYLQVFMDIMCFNVSICFKMGSLYSYCDIITKLVYPQELSRIAGFCTNSNKNFLGEDPKPPFQAELFEAVF